MGDEERRRQEPDRDERDTVRLREGVGDRADVGDVPRQKAARRETCGDRRRLGETADTRSYEPAAT
jgi:hypothetical protein